MLSSNVLSQVFIVKCFSKSLLLRIIIIITIIIMTIKWYDKVNVVLPRYTKKLGKSPMFEDNNKKSILINFLHY